jgi:ribosomal protein L37E
VPAGTPTRLFADTESVIMHYKESQPGLQGVARYCELCRAELYRYVFDTARSSSHEGYLTGRRDFNQNEARRRCSACGWVQPVIEFGRYRWEAAAKLIGGP